MKNKLWAKQQLSMIQLIIITKKNLSIKLSKIKKKETKVLIFGNQLLNKMPKKYAGKL